MVTAKLENLIIYPKDLEAIHNDERILKQELPVREGSLWIANNAHAGITDQHQLYAKGIVYHLLDGVFTLVSMPYVKFYNDFEDVCVKDLEDLWYEDVRVVKKQDGTLISRFVWDEEVYFATRGNILVPGKQFWNPVMKLVLLNHTGMEKLNDYDYEGVTYLFEYVGPSNVILEPYEKDELVGIGIHYFSPLNGGWEVREYPISNMDIPNSWNIRLTPTYNLKDPKEILKTLEGIQEGVIVEYILGGKIVYRVKFKQEAYIKALKSRSFVDKIDPIILLEKNGWSIEAALHSLEAELKENPFKEELLHTVEEKLRSEEVVNKCKELQRLAWILQENRNHLVNLVKSGTSRKDIYTLVSESNLKQFTGIMMNAIYKEYPTSRFFLDIYKVTG